MHRLICGDVLDVLPTLGRFKLLIADPPDNIGLGYDEYQDSMPKSDYHALLRRWLTMFIDKAEIVWFSFNAKWVFAIGRIIENYFYHYDARLFIQSFTFGQNNKYDCGNGYRPLLRLKHRDAAIYPEAIRVPSQRQLTGDKRAAVGGRVPLDHWADFPRITGNCRERRAWHPTQLREGMIERIIKFSTQPGDSICDAFSGTGTVLRAVGNLSPGPPEWQPRNPVTSIELDAGYCAKIAAEHGLTVETLREAA
jgi:DNA modification methylase